MLFTIGFVVLFLLLWLIFLGAERALERVLAKAAHATAKLRYRDYVPVVVVLIAGLAAAVFVGDSFIDIAERVQADSPKLQQIDARVHAWARHAHTAGSTRFFTTMTIIGTPGPLAGLLAIVASVLMARKHWRRAVYLAFTAGMGGVLNLMLKSFFERARPDLAIALRQASGYSFPSGHAMGSAIVFLALAYLALRALTSWRTRAAALALAVTMVLSIASSRIYLGVHWISDVGAGLAAGLVWVMTTTVAYETFRRIRMLRALRAKRVSSPANENN